GVMHVHFNGAGGNVAAGKYNDGHPSNRPILAQRLAAGMKTAYDGVKRVAIASDDLTWRVKPVALPLSPRYKTSELKKVIADDSVKDLDRMRAARAFVWARRCESGETIDLTCLKLGPVYVLHMPGELFVEYQVAAQQMRPEAPVMMAAYGDYGCGYIGTAIAYTQGGYETGPVSRVAPEVEGVLMAAMKDLLR
ncbi:MAG: hypothetical protein NZO58_06360, partial [Gemmataceae bacterium]|nr:hypothetical protein [Gemmataceae bacterium]